MIYRMMRVMFVLAGLVFVSGCFASDPAFKAAIDKADATMKDVLQAELKFDPYSNDIYYNHDIVNNRYRQVFQELRGINGRATDVSMKNNYTDDNLERHIRGFIMPRFDTTFANQKPEIAAKAAAHMKKYGWAIFQVSYAKHEEAFGSYRVKVLFFGEVDEPGGIQFHTHSLWVPLEVSYKDPKQEQPMPKSTSAAAPAALDEKLSSLKKARDAGLITEQEYQTKRKALIDQY